MTISVCIPTFNQGQYLEKSIKSALYQSIKPDEIIVSNDCSTDETRQILERLQSEIPILRVVHQEKNLGMVKNTNYCLQLSKSELIVKLDSDDYLLPKYIETLSVLLEQHAEAGYAHAAVQEIDENDKRGKVRRLYRQTGYQSSDQALKALVRGYNVSANIIMFRQTALQSANYITSNVAFGEDYYLAVEISNNGFGNVYSDSILASYRVWNDTGNVRQKRKLNEINGLRIIFDRPLKEAFLKRGWDLNILAKRKEEFACNQSNCLMWKIYSSKEKQELEQSILELSDTKKVKIYILAYKKRLGSFVQGPKKLFRSVKQVVKAVIK